LDDECRECDNCQEPVCIGQIFEHHRLMPNEFLHHVIQYYADNDIDVLHIPDPLQMTSDDIDAIIGTATCATHCLAFDIDAGHLNTHQDMVLSLYNSCDPPAPHDRYYSIALFRGIMALPSAPDRFEFVRINDAKT